MLLVPQHVVDKTPALQEYMETGHVKDKQSLQKDLERSKIQGGNYYYVSRDQ